MCAKNNASSAALPEKGRLARTAHFAPLPTPSPHVCMTVTFSGETVDTSKYTVVRIQDSGQHVECRGWVRATYYCRGVMSLLFPVLRKAP
jgi:hypothetical protein